MGKRTLIEIKPHCVQALQSIADAMGGVSLSDAASYLITNFSQPVVAHLKGVASVGVVSLQPPTTNQVLPIPLLQVTQQPEKTTFFSDEQDYDAEDAFGALGL